MGITAAFFIFLGTASKAKLWLVVGCLILIVIGIFIMSTGIDLPSGMNVGETQGHIISQYAQDDNTIKLIDFNVSDFNVSKTYTNISSADTISQWLFGFLFVIIGALVIFISLFDRRYKEWI